MKYYAVVWNDFEAGLECFLYARKDLAEEFAFNTIVETYAELEDVKWDFEYEFAKLEDRFEMCIREVQLLK